MKRTVFVLILCFALLFCVGCSDAPGPEPTSGATQATSAPATTEPTETSAPPTTVETEPIPETEPVAETEPLMVQEPTDFYPFTQEQLSAARAAAVAYTETFFPEPDEYNYFKLFLIAYDPVLTHSIIDSDYDADTQDWDAYYGSYAAFSVRYEQAKTPIHSTSYKTGTGYVLCKLTDSKWSVEQYHENRGTENALSQEELLGFSGFGNLIAGYSDGLQGCTLYGVDDSGTQVIKTRLSSQALTQPGRVLSQEEMAEFTTMFSGAFDREDLLWYNFALKSIFETPAQLDLYEYFYNAPWYDPSAITQTELDFLEVPSTGPESAIHKYPVAQMNEILTKHFGYTLDQMDGIGLDKMVYNPSTDAYYTTHGDMHLAYPQFLEGIASEDGTVTIYYTNYEAITTANIERLEAGLPYVRPECTMQVTLKPDGAGNYLILSNVPAGLTVYDQ